MFFAVAALSFAAEGEGARAARGPGEGRPERSKNLKAATTMVDKYVAKDVGLAAENTEKFLAAMGAQREGFDKKTADARKAGGATDFRALMEERSKGVDAVLSANMTPEQAKKAKAVYDMFGLEQAVASLLDAKVEPAKVEKALPMLVKYYKATSELRTKARAGEMSREDATAKSKELRGATAKELAPIIGEEAATTWGSQSDMGGRRGMGGGARPEGGEKGDRPAKGERKGGEKAPAAPVAP